MNICLFLIAGFWGGAETVVYELAKHLRHKGETVSMVLNEEYEVLARQIKEKYFQQSLEGAV